ncbi:MAG: FIST N-terminal domain-containing protein [Myxococcales bacterium]
MLALSASTSTSDPYRAGVSLGEALKPVSPEVAFLFTSIHYCGENSDLLAGLHDALEDERVVVVGNSGDGVYESARVSHYGAAALGVSTEGRVRWVTAQARGVGADPVGATRQCLQRLRESGPGGEPALLFMASDFRTDSSRIEEALGLGTRVPLVGGLAADDDRLQRCFVYSGDEVLEDALVLLGAYGDLAFDITVGNALRTIGSPGRVTEAAGTRLARIDDLPAMDFVERETGKPALRTDRGIVSLAILDGVHPGLRRLRSVIPEFDKPGGGLALYGGIAEGQRVGVCVAEPEDLVREVYAIAESARTLDFQPAAALVVSCAGRKWLLGDQIDHEVRALSSVFPRGLPLVGFPSFAEFGPLKENGRYTPTYAHNMTYVLLLLGERG